MTVGWLWWLTTGFVGVQLLTLLSNVVAFPVLEAPEQDEGAAGATAPLPKVSILIPARNEEDNLPATLPRVLAQRGSHEVLVLNDNSDDRTAEVLALFAAQSPKLRVLQGEPLPEGWSGKNWACQQLADAASGTLLIFTDADVYWETETLGALLEFQHAQKAAFVSVWPRQITRTLLERLTVPITDMILLGMLPYLGVKHLPFGALSAGNGQLMLWTRRAYRRVGGHAAFRGEVLEDVRMGQAAKRRGLRVALALGGDMLSARMYRGEAAVIEGFSKNILSAHGNSRPFLALSLVLNTLAYTLSWVFALINPLWTVPAALGLFQRALTAYKTRRTPLEAFLQPVTAYPLWRIGVRALARNGRYRWRGRDYER